MPAPSPCSPSPPRSLKRIEVTSEWQREPWCVREASGRTAWRQTAAVYCFLCSAAAELLDDRREQERCTWSFISCHSCPPRDPRPGCRGGAGGITQITLSPPGRPSRSHRQAVGCTDTHTKKKKLYMYYCTHVTVVIKEGLWRGMIEVIIVAG